MTLSNDSVTVTPGAGATIATHLIAAKEHQAIVEVDNTGHIKGSRDVYVYEIASQVHVAAANTVHWDLFNADPSLIVRVLGIFQLPNINTAVTGIAFDWQLMRTTTVGTGGTVINAWLPDTSQTALDADITMRSKPTGGATASTVLANYTINSEETNAATQLWHTQAAGGELNLIPPALRPPLSERGIVLRANQGLRCVQVTNSVAGNTGWRVVITVE